MAPEVFHDAAVILVAHGSTVNARSCAACYQQADALRRLGLFAAVTEAFVQQDPPLGGALRAVLAPRVFIVPLFISDGWFTEHAIPVELGLRKRESTSLERTQRRGAQTLHYCRAVGSHPRMTEVLLARAADVVARHPFPFSPKTSESALLIAGHGTSYSRGSRDAIAEQVSRITKAGRYREVHGVFLEEAPFVRESWNLTACANLILVPYFISDGLHVQEDIPIMLGEPAETVRQRLSAGLPPWRNPTARQGRRLWYAGAVGTEPSLAEVILDRIREAAAISAAPPE